jgi:hypothetical protein
MGDLKFSEEILAPTTVKLAACGDYRDPTAATQPPKTYGGLDFELLGNQPNHSTEGLGDRFRWVLRQVELFRREFEWLSIREPPKVYKTLREQCAAWEIEEKEQREKSRKLGPMYRVVEELGRGTTSVVQLVVMLPGNLKNLL